MLLDAVACDTGRIDYGLEIEEWSRNDEKFVTGCEVGSSLSLTIATTQYQLELECADRPCR